RPARPRGLNPRGEDLVRLLGAVANRDLRLEAPELLEGDARDGIGHVVEDDFIEVLDGAVLPHRRVHLVGGGKEEIGHASPSRCWACGGDGCGRGANPRPAGRSAACAPTPPSVPVGRQSPASAGSRRRRWYTTPRSP